MKYYPYDITAPIVDNTLPQILDLVIAKNVTIQTAVWYNLQASDCSLSNFFSFTADEDGSLRVHYINGGETSHLDEFFNRYFEDDIFPLVDIASAIAGYKKEED